MRVKTEKIIIPNGLWKDQIFFRDHLDFSDRDIQKKKVIRPNKINDLILRPFLSKSDEGMRHFFLNFVEVKIDEGNFPPNISICFYDYLVFFSFKITSSVTCFWWVVECWLLFISHSPWFCCYL